MSWNPDKYLAAWNFATLHHKSQKYGKHPYLTHIGAVVGEVAWALNSSPELNADLAVQVAILHDVLEDTKASYDLIIDTFGLQVARGVLALTKNPQLNDDKFKQMRDCLKRIQREPPEISIVKLADRIVNLQSLPDHWYVPKCRAYLAESKIIYMSLNQSHKPLAKRLQLKIERYENLIIEKLCAVNQNTKAIIPNV